MKILFQYLSLGRKFEIMHKLGGPDLNRGSRIKKENNDSIYDMNDSNSNNDIDNDNDSNNNKKIIIIIITIMATSSVVLR